MAKGRSRARHWASWASPSRRIASPTWPTSPVSSASDEELLGTEQPALGVEPAGQRLEADDVAGRQLDDRLVVRHDLAAVDAAAQLRGGAQGERRRLLQPGGVGLDAVAAAGLRPVHRPVGVAQQVGGDGRLGGVDREADAGRDEELGALDVDRLADRRAQPLGHSPGIERVVGLGLQHDDELVAAEAGEQRAVADGAADPLRQHRQQPVADAVAEAVVDRLEVVEVDEQQRHRADRRTRRAARRPGTAARCGWAAR